MIWRLGLREDLPDAGVEPQQSRRPVELLEHGVEDAAAAFHGFSLARSPGTAETQTGQRTLGERGKSTEDRLKVSGSR